MTIEGVIEEIVFRNEENGYTVATIAREKQLDYITIVGKFLSINIGETVRLEGKFTHSKYGEQFSFESYEIIMPSTVEGIKKYLSSGLIRGIGPVTAELIVRRFKEDTLDVIAFAPQKLAEIRGISEKKAELISQTFNDIKKMQNSVMFLQGYNVSVNMAIKIYNIYGDRTIDIVKSNPYRLVEDIDGIGFTSADKIARSMGIKQDSPFRLRAGLVHIMTETAEKNGNTFLYQDMLLEQAAKLLALDLEEYKQAFLGCLDDLTFDKVFTKQQSRGQQIIMLTKYYFTETSVAQKLALLAFSAVEIDKDVTEEIKLFENINKISFDADQKNAIVNSIRCGVSVITGGPGTGKTTIIKCILNILEQQNKKVMLLAPTGRAAKRLSESTGKEAKTIHRGLDLAFGGKNPAAFTYNENNPLNTDCVIVDEVSMVDVSLMNSLLKAMPRDCKFIMVGDKDQLPSVGAGNVLDDILKSGTITVNYLTKIFRQDDKSMIITNAHLINEGKMPIIDNTSSDFFFENKDDATDIKNTIVGLVTSRLPNYLKIDSTKIQVLAPMKLGASGVEALNIDLQEKLNPPSTRKVEITVGSSIFREGDKVMQTANNYNLEWKRRIALLWEDGMGVFNGDIGFIHEINRQTGEITVWFDDGRECTYPRTEVNDLSLAYAITIHKSQGSEFDVVAIPIISGPSIILTRNLIYTAVTRAKKMVVLVGSKQNLHRMVANAYTVQRFTMLKEFLVNSYRKCKEMFED